MKLTQDTFFTICRDPEVESLLGECLEDFRCRIEALPESLRRPLAAVLLGGGYGIGEGGVAIRPDGNRPYNDLDFFVFTRGASADERAALDAALRALGAGWHERLGIEIDFAGAREVGNLSGVASTMMYQALRAGHRTVYGDPEVLADFPELPAEQLPLREGLRLLLNRGTGLLLAHEKIRNRQTDADGVDFIRRNWYKGVFGVGDALLVARHAYSFRLSERTERLNDAAAALLLPEEAARLENWYAEAIEFKIRPSAGSLDETLRRLPPLMDLWQSALFAILAGATGGKVTNVAEAQRALSRRDILGGGKSWKNVLLNLRYNPYLAVKKRLDTSPQLWVLADLAQILFEIRTGEGYSIKSETERKITHYLPLWQRFN